MALSLHALALALLGVVACGGSEAISEADGVSLAATDAPPPASTTPAVATTSDQAPTPPPPTPPPPGPQIPAGLACLAKHFVGAATAQGTGWALKLPDGTMLPWDDGKKKTLAVAMETPDLEDTLSLPYVLGPIAPDNTVDRDPGRIRNDALFKATYGASAAAVRANLVTVDFVGQNVRFHKRAAAALAKVSTRLRALVAATPSLGAYVAGDLGGTFAWRPIANSTRMSAHSYGVAIDIVVARSNYWEWEKTPSGTFVWTNQIPQAVVDAFESEGFAWGGRWYHYDTMHFEWRPELFDADCKP